MTNTLYDTLIAPHSKNTASFLTMNAGKRRISYSDFCSQVAQYAHVLVECGVTPGERVAVQLPKSVEMVILYAATIQAGAVFLPLNTAYTHDELSYFIQDASPKIIVGTDASKNDLRRLAVAAEAQIMTLNPNGSGSLSDAAAKKPKLFQTVARKPDDLAALLYTSGTTGRSKGAMLTHENLTSNAQTLVDTWKMTVDDVLIHALPIFHTHGLFVALNSALLAGMQVNFMPKFDVDEIVNALPDATLLMGVPTFYTRLLSDPRLNKEAVSNMRLFISGSAPLLAETHDAFSAKTGHRILERYGMTETNMNTSNPYSGPRIAGSVGLPLEGTEIRLTDSNTGEKVEDGEIGMIEVRGPNVFKGYWNMPEKTAEELRENGFFITGDLGQFDAHGYLSIVGRQKDLIITGGYNVYPKEIEDILNEIHGVKESAVFGVPDPDFGEMIVAAIVSEGGEVIEDQALESAVKDKLARFKHPRIYQKLDELPRNTMGKVQKNVLRDSYSTR